MTIDARAFRQLGDLFQELCDAPVDVQQARVAGLEDEALASQLARMLEVDRRATRLLHTSAGVGPLLAADLARDPPPTRIGPFEIIGLLGAGGMGVVYEAQQAHPQRRLALKVLHASLMSDEARELFRFEAQSLANLRHPGVPQVYDAGEDGGRPWMAMELVRGQPLDRFVTHARLGARERLALCVEVARTVHHAHEAGILHRDLKPSNVLVSPEGLPKVLDFGIATSLLQARAEGRFQGTPAWASPEQLRGAPVDVTADVYALGTLTWQVVADRLPYAVDDLDPQAAARAKERPAPPLPGPDVPSDAAWWVGRALAPDPAHRPPTAAAFADGLERALHDLPLPGRGGLGYRMRCFARRHRRALAAGALATGVVVAALGGRPALEARAEAARHDAAERHRRALEPTLEAYAAAGRWSEAEALFAAFARLPEHEGTPALARAWTLHGRRRAAGDQPEVLDALARGWLTSPDAASRQEAGEALVDALIERARYDEAGAVAAGLTRTPPVARALLQAAVAAGDLEGALALGAEPRAVIERLSRARPLDVLARDGRLLDVDGDGVPELVATEPDGAISVRGLEDDDGWRLPLPPGSDPNPQVLAARGALIAVARCCDSFGGAPRVLVAEPGDTDWTEVAALPPSRNAGVARLGGTLYVGTTYPDRGLWAVDLDSGVVTRPDPDTIGLDVPAVAAMDLTGDGAEELVVGTGAGLRVYADDGSGAALLGEAPMGWIRGVAPGRPGEVLVQAGALAHAALGPEGLSPGPARTLRHDLPGEAGCTGPIVADLDGDGADEWLLSCFPPQPANVRTYVLSEDGEDLVLQGISAHDAADVDGDGLAEVLVARDGALWLLGQGTTTCLRPPPTRRQLEPPPGLDATARAAWSRAQRLLDVGLAGLAAKELASVAPLLDDPAHRARAHVAAARLSEASGAPAGTATAEWVAAARGGLPPDELAEARAHARDGLAYALRLPEARAFDDAGDLAWVDALSPHPLLARPHLDPAWSVHRPEAVTWRDGWRLAVLNDDGVVMSLPVDVVGEAVGLELEASVRSAELAGGVAVQLVDDTGRVLLGAGLDAWGYGGMVRLRTRGRVDGDTTLGDYAEDDRDHTVRTFWLPRRGRGAVDDRGTPYWSEVGPVPPPGRYELRIVSHGDLGYAPALGLVLEVRALRLYGMRPAPEQGVRAAPSPVAVALAAGDPEALERALEERVRAGDRAGLRRWLRREPTWIAPPLRRLLGDDFGPLFAEAWADPFSQYPDRSEVRAAALSPALDGLAVTDPLTGRLALARGRVLIRAGRPDLAVHVLRSALASPEAAPAAHAALGQALVATDPDAARRHREEARALGVAVEEP